MRLDKIANLTDPCRRKEPSILPRCKDVTRLRCARPVAQTPAMIRVRLGGWASYENFAEAADNP
jgi:hypothetical protein